MVFQISENAELEFFETSARTGEGVTEVTKIKNYFAINLVIWQFTCVVHNMTPLIRLFKVK